MFFETASDKTAHPSDFSDEEWASCAPYLTLMSEETAQREHSLRSGLQRSALLDALGMAVADDPQ